MKIIKWILIIYLFIIILLVCCGCNKKEEKMKEVYLPSLDQCYESMIVMETSSKRVLYGKNINERLLPASITKILTCITVLENFSTDQYLLITKDMLQVNGSKIYLEENDVVKVEDLLYGLMLNSGNDSAVAISIGLTGSIENFAYLMNETAKKIGMKNSTFSNPHGLDEETKNYTTAYDMGLLMSYAMKNKQFRKINQTIEYCPIIPSGRRLYFLNKHRLIKQGIATGGKTGYTKAAHRTLVSTFEKDNMEIVVVTFNCSNDWFIHKDLANKAFEEYQMKEVYSTFYVLWNMIEYPDFTINNQDILIPININENIKDINLRFHFINNQNTLLLEYYYNDKSNNILCYRQIDKIINVDDFVNNDKNSEVKFYD